MANAQVVRETSATGVDVNEYRYTGEQFDFEKGYAENLPAAQTKVRTFICPASKEEATSEAVTHYVAMSGIGHIAATQPAGAEMFNVR